jgi:hypothetical protein
MAQDTIQKIINVQFKYDDLISGWKEASAAIDNAKKKLDEFKKEGDTGGVAKQTQLIKALRAEMSQYTREIQANVKEEVKAEGSINQLNARIAKLTAQYNAMAGEIRKSATGEALAKEIADVQAEVNKANESLLNFRNNVGNYASAAKGFTPLSFQVQQLAREVPSLTMSFQQFFLAISNNLPMFADELTRAKEANKALRAEGKATVPVFKQVASAIFSWQTALVVGITLLISYGKEIAKWGKSLLSTKDAAITASQVQADVNKKLEDSANPIGDQISKIKLLQKQWSGLGNDLSAKQKFVEENKDAFDELGVSVSNVNDAENLLVKSTDDFIKAMEMRAMAAAGLELAAEKYKEAFIEQLKIEKKIAKGKTEGYITGGSPTTGGAQYTYTTRPYTEEEKQDMMSRASALKQQAEAYLTLSNEKQNDAKKTLSNAGIVESANAEVVKSIEELINMEGILAQVRERNAQKYAKSVSEQQRTVYKSVAKIEDDIAKSTRDIDRTWTSSMRDIFQQKQAEYKNRILQAQLSGGDEGAQKEALKIAQEQLEVYKQQLEDVNTFEAAYRNMGYSDIEIQNMRLQARLNVANAEEAIKQAQAVSLQQSLSSVEQLIGAFGGLAEAAGASAELSGVLAIAQSAAAMGMALAKAFSSSATIWDAIAGVAAAIATITTVVSTIRSLGDSASDEGRKYRYAKGGLVTGPGTATSDSIPANLSNGESVMTARATSEWGDLLSAINVSSGGNAINVSNLPQRGDGMRGMERMMERVMLKMPAPVVSVVDINKGQKRVKVSDNLGKLGRKK